MATGSVVGAVVTITGVPVVGAVMTTTGASTGGVTGKVTTAVMTGGTTGPVRVHVWLPSLTVVTYTCSLNSSASCISFSTSSSSVVSQSPILSEC